MSDPLVEVHRVVVHAVPGFWALPVPSLSLLSESQGSVWLTLEPDQLSFHVDRKYALATLLLTGGFSERFEERFSSAISEARSYRRQARSPVWLVTDVSVSAQPPAEPMYEWTEFGISFDSISEGTH
jgi:hypothetical protein